MNKILSLMLLALMATTAFAQNNKSKVREGVRAKVIPQMMEQLRDPQHRMHHSSSLKAATSEFITEQPEGTLKEYVRQQGIQVMAWGGALESTVQNPQIVKLVYADDGKTVWFGNMLSFGTLPDFGWVKGELSADGKEIRVPAGQTIFSYYFEGNPEYGIPAETTSGVISLLKYRAIDAESFTYEPIDDDIVWIVDEEADLISLSPEVNGDDLLLGTIYDTPDNPDNDGFWTGTADYETVLSPLDLDNPTPPASATIQDYAITYDYTDWNGTRPLGKLCQVAFNGSDVYINKLCSQFPDVWLKGTLADGKLTIPASNIGINDWQTLVFFCKMDYFDFWGYGYLEPGPDGGDVVFSYNAETGAFTCDVECCFSDGYTYTTESYTNLVLTPFVEKPATPATPEIYRYSLTPDFEDEGREHPRGNSYFTDINVPPFDVDGNFLNTDKLYYMYYTGDDVPFVFTHDNYTFTTERDGFDHEPEWEGEFTEIPYSFTDEYMDFSNIRTFLRWGEITRLGIQSIYYGGGEEHRSPINYFEDGQDDAVESISGDDLTAPTAIYNLQGHRLLMPQKGLNIVRMANGKAHKVIMK